MPPMPLDITFSIMNFPRHPVRPVSLCFGWPLSVRTASHLLISSCSSRFLVIAVSSFRSSFSQVSESLPLLSRQCPSLPDPPQRYPLFPNCYHVPFLVVTHGSVSFLGVFTTPSLSSLVVRCDVAPVLPGTGVGRWGCRWDVHRRRAWFPSAGRFWAAMPGFFHRCLGRVLCFPLATWVGRAYRAVGSGMTISDMFFIPWSLFCSYPAHSLALILFDFRVGEHGV